MNLELVNPFVSAAFSVVEAVLGNTPQKGELRIQKDGITSHQVNVAVGVTGDINGHIIFGMSLQTADRIATAMIGVPIRTFDKLAASAIAELGNMVGGNGLLHLSESGYVCDITPPTVIRGQNVEISTLAIPALVIPLNVEQGELLLTIGLQVAQKQAA
jgi:chemotaxis protein CheX